jgi:hypothetical protein
MLESSYDLQEESQGKTVSGWEPCSEDDFDYQV